VAPTAAFVGDNSIDFREGEMRARLSQAVGAGNVDFIDATGVATALTGDSISTNLFMLGYAFQRGLVPLGLAALMRAIELNGVAVEQSKRTFAWGRRAAVAWDTVEAADRPTIPRRGEVPRGLRAVTDHRAEHLRLYQDDAYAARYRAFVDEVDAAERARAAGRTGLAEAVARNLAKLMAYKDEYEVARLYADGAFRQRLAAQFAGSYRLELLLAPPLLARIDPATGEPAKRAFGPWIFPVLGALARLKRLRGTALDPFGYTKERKLERRLIDDYQERIRGVLGRLTPANHALAVEIAEIPDAIRGYGHVKARSIAKAQEAEAALLARFARDDALAPAAE